MDADELGLPPLPTAFVAGEDLDLLAPLRVVRPGALELAPAPRVDRSEIAAALARANASYGHPAAASLAERLADPATRVVITGQQPGLFGGPLYTLSKALAAVLWAERLQAAGQPAVALFWVATEDHDYAEVARASLLPDGRLFDAELGADPAPLTPVGMRTLGEPVAAALAGATERASSPRYREWLERLGAWYRPDARFGEAFCRLLADLFGERGPLWVDSQLPELKQLQRPWLERLVERREQIEVSLAEREQQIVSRGFPLQVKPQPEAGQLFLLRDGRRRVVWQGEGYGLRGAEQTGSIEELLESIRENPSAVSPGALSRPAIQDAVFGSSLQILGPGELSYFAQASVLHEVLGVEAAGVALRPRMLLLDPRQQSQLQELGISVAEMAAAEADGDRLLTRDQGVDPGPAARSEVAELLDRLRAGALEIDPNLERAWQKTKMQIDRALEGFSSRVVAAVARQDEVRRQRFEALRTAIRPGGAPQERRLAVAHFVGRYGEGLAQRLLERFELEPLGVQLIDPS